MRIFSVLSTLALATAALAQFCTGESENVFMWGYLKIPHNDGSGLESYLTIRNSPSLPQFDGELIIVSEAQFAERFYICQIQGYVDGILYIVSGKHAVHGRV